MFDNCETGNVVDELVKIIPNIVTRLRKEGMFADFVTFLRLINEDKFPLNNISFLLLLEVSRWYSLQTTTHMFYSEETMKFSKVLYRMFHGKALRFMPGTKAVGQVLCDSSHTSIGNYDPQKTNINFAVPNTHTIINYTSMGIITSTLELKSKENSYILSVDGKKLTPGLNENSGDQDLFGYETSQTDSLQFFTRTN